MAIRTWYGFFPPFRGTELMETGASRGVESHCEENAMLPLMIGMGVPVFAVIAYALTRPDPPEADRRARA